MLTLRTKIPFRVPKSNLFRETNPKRLSGSPFPISCVNGEVTNRTFYGEAVRNCHSVARLIQDDNSKCVLLRKSS
jgi:hypothetical protein